MPTLTHQLHNSATHKPGYDPACPRCARNEMADVVRSLRAQFTPGTYTWTALTVAADRLQSSNPHAFQQACLRAHKEVF